MAASFAHAYLHSSFTLTYTPDHVARGVTENVTLRCAHDGRTRSLLIEVARIRLLRKTGKGWALLAEKRDLEEPVILESDSLVTGSTDGGIQSTFLEVTWPIAVDLTMGVYRCDVIGFEKAARSAVDSTALVEITDVFVSDLIDMLLETKRQLAAQSTATKENVTIRDVYDIIDSLHQNYSFLKSESTSVQAELDSIKKEMKIIEENVFALWPIGSYALLQPAAGCPRGSSFANQSGSFYRLLTESTSRSGNEDSHSAILPPNTSYQNGGRNFIELHFCERTQIEQSTTFWPDGSYCMNKIAGLLCPSGFDDGAIELDGEDNNPVQEHEGNVLYKSTGHDALIGFCCRSSKAHTSSYPIPLPSGSPFLLYRRGGVCQEVLNMQVTYTSLSVDTEDKANGDRIYGAVPDVDVNIDKTTTFHLCYYS